MSTHIIVNKKLDSFNKKINISGDKSLSIRWLLLASQAIGISKAYNLLESDDIKSTIKALKQIGVSIIKKNKIYQVEGLGINNFNIKSNCVINAGNSGTLARLILGVISGSSKKIKLIGDNSLSKRDFKRVILPLQKFGAKIKSKKNSLPIHFQGNEFCRPINYQENIGSAQVKSCIMLSALNTKGTTKIKAKKSRNHTEILFKKIGIPIKINSTKNYDIIQVKGKNNFSSFDYKIPGDISSASFFIVLTLLSKKSKLLLRNININQSRTGLIDCLMKMNCKIIMKNKRKYMGEELSDIYIESSKNLRAINCPVSINSRAIDEMLLLFIVASVSKGVSRFKNLGELNKKESKRLNWGFKILKMIGIKTKKLKNNGIEIFGKPDNKLHGKFEIRNYLKDHRIFMLSMVIALTLGGKWKIHDKESIKTSFPHFLKTIKKLGAKFS